MHKIINGNCLEVMKTFPDNHFNCVVTDPPYGLHFMGKTWDSRTPNIDIWQEAFRICKPGSMLMAFGAPRTHHKLMHALECAGWEIRDVIMWIYGSGFPKSHNKFGFDGYGTALKPAYEPIILAMKPLDGTFANNAEKWGVAGINIDDCRINTEDNLGRETSSDTLYKGGWKKINVPNPKRGRWPSNLILDEISAEMLDQQTGNNVSRFFYCAKASSKERNAGLEGMPLKKCGMMEDDNYKWPDGRDKHAQNNHPTVKPLSLMKYLLTLLAPPGNPICLDPFSGSGSTLVAAKELGIECVGIELSDEYCEIANARIKHAKVPDPELF